MTELETLQRAKMYMEKLASGIDPIGNNPVAEGDTLNNERLSKCFSYVANVLERVIAAGGLPPEKKPKKEPFNLPIEKRRYFAFSDMPIPVSEVSKRINALVDKERVTALSYNAIRDWLISLNMLEEVLGGDGKPVKRPTQLGESMGIVLESRDGPNGLYFVTVYALEAQHFILDNLDAIISFANFQTANQGKPWTQEQDHCLIALYQKGVSINEIAATLKRNSGAIHSRVKKLNLSDTKG